MTLQQRVNEFVEIFLFSEPSPSKKGKFLHDPIWGGIEIMPWEQCIVDTPLFQRLAQIHQTGCVYATYPSARHTRFEHTLGVMHLAGRMAEQLEKRKVVDQEIDFVKTRQAVRLAALIHDLGHSAFSHTSEEIYKNCSDIQTLTSESGPFEDKGAGEVLSYLIATSDAFRRFFTTIRHRHSELTVDVDDFAPLVLGSPSSNRKEMLFEANIISAPFDADKLDYFPRDGRAAGLEVALDVDRLLNCVEIQQHSDSSRAQSGLKLVVHRGGFNPLQQLLFARATLFSSVYHHHKVRACDCMIKGVFELFSETGKGFSASQMLKKSIDHSSAADFLYITDASFFAEASKYDPGTIHHDLIHDLLYRRLLKRTLTISTFTIDWKATELAAPNLPSESNPVCRACGQSVDASSDVVSEVEYPKAHAIYGNFYNCRSNSSKLRELAREIFEKSGVECTKHRVWFDLPTTPSFKKAGDALIRTSPEGEPVVIEKLVKFIPIEKWVQTYEQYYAQGYLFGPPDVESRVKLAIEARRKLKEEYFLILKSDCMPSDIRYEVLEAERKMACKKEFC